MSAGGRDVWKGDYCEGREGREGLLGMEGREFCALNTKFNIKKLTNIIWPKRP